MRLEKCLLDPANGGLGQLGPWGRKLGNDSELAACKTLGLVFDAFCYAAKRSPKASANAISYARIAPAVPRHCPSMHRDLRRANEMLQRCLPT